MKKLMNTMKKIVTLLSAVALLAGSFPLTVRAVELATYEYLFKPTIIYDGVDASDISFSLNGGGVTDKTLTSGENFNVELYNMGFMKTNFSITCSNPKNQNILVSYSGKIRFLSDVRTSNIDFNTNESHGCSFSILHDSGAQQPDIQVKITVKLNNSNDVNLPTGLTGGSITSDKENPVTTDEIVTLTAVPDTGYFPVSLSANRYSGGKAAVDWYGSFDNTATFTMPSEAVDVSASFTNVLTAAEGLFTRIPKNKQNNVIIPDGVTSFKIYGEDTKYEYLNISTLKLTAPEGYVIKLTGTIWDSTGTFAIKVYDGGSTNSRQLCDCKVFDPTTGGYQAIPDNVVSTGNTMLIYTDAVIDCYPSFDLTAAVFDPDADTTVRINQKAGGTVAADRPNMDYASGETVTLTASPEDGYLLSGITVTDAAGNAVSVGGGSVTDTLSFKMPATSVTVTPTFTDTWTADGGLFAYIPKQGTISGNIPAGVTSFKIYDDGGATRNYSPNCNGKLSLTAPDGCRLRLTGRIWAHDTNDSFNVYDGENAEAPRFNIVDYDAKEYKNIGTHDSTGKSMTLSFYSNNATEDPGLDLTVAVMYKAAVSDSVTHGTVSTDKDFAAAGSTVNLTLTPDTLYHIDTVSYNDGTDHTITPDSNGKYSFVMPAKNVTVTASFALNTYKVKFNGNGSTAGSMGDQDFIYGTAQNLTANRFSRVLSVSYNYNGATGGNSLTSDTATATFNGWATSSSGAKAYDDRQSVNNLTTENGKTVNLYANWTDSGVTLPTPTKIDNVFGGWCSDEGLNTKVGDGGDPYIPTADIRLYAKWKTEINPVVSITGWTYGGAENTPSVTGASNPGAGTVSYEYFKDAACTTRTTTANSGAASEGSVPKNAGTYYVKATVAETAAYKSGTGKARFTIGKAADKAISDITRSMSKSTTGINISLASAIPADVGTVSECRINGGVSRTGSVTVSDAGVNKECVVTAALSGGAAGDTITIPVKIIAQNYDCTINVCITLSDLEDPVFTAPEANTLNFNGTDQVLISKGSITTGGSMLYSLNGTDWSSEPPKGKNAGNYTVYYKIEETAEVNGVDPTPINVSIARKTVTVKADDKTKIKNETDPELTATVTGLVGSDTVSFNVIRENGETVGTYTITPSGDVEQGNYTVTYETGTFTISNCAHEHTEIRGFVKATCTTKGYTGDTWCTDCDHKVADGEETPIDPDNHDYEVKITREATVLSEGEKTYICKRCHHSYTEKIPRVDDGNDYSELIGDTDTLSGDSAPKVEVSENTTEKTESIKIGGEEVSKTITDKESGKETVETKVWIGGLLSSYIYTGSAIKPSFHVYDGTRKLTEKTDYSVSYSKNRDVGTATVTVKFKGNYKDTKNETVNFRIDPAVLVKNIKVHEIGVAAKKSGETKVSPVLTWAETGKTVSSKYFSITPSSVTGEGTTTATITPKNGQKNFAGTATVQIRAVADKDKVLSNAKVKFDKKSYAYTGSEIIPKYELTLGGKKLTEGTDYKRVSITGNTEPGTAAIIFEATGSDYVGSKTATFKISGKKELKEGDSFSFALRSGSVPYAKGGAKPAVTVTDNDKHAVLKEGKDYTLSYAKNKAVTNGAKNAQVQVKGKGNYKGTVPLTFAITQQNFLALGGNIVIADQFTTKEKVKNPSITITDLDGKKLKVNTDYTVGPLDTSDPSNTDTKGIVKVTITGKGAYKEEQIPVTFRYEDKTFDISKAKTAKKIDDQAYTGKAVKLSKSELTGILTVKDKSGATVTLVPGTDFKVKGYVNNIKTGTARVTVQGIGNYAGTKTLTFKIVQKKVDYKGALVGGNWK